MTIDRQDILDRLTSGDDVVRYDAVVDAVAAKLVDAIAPIAKLLSTADLALRANAVEALGVLGAESAHHREEALRALVAALTDPAPLVRANAAEGLGVIGDPEAIDELGRVLARDRDALVRAAAAEALAEIGDNRGHDALTRAAEHDRAPAVRAFAIWGLGLLGKSGDDAFLARLRTSERDVHGQLELLAALARFGDASAVAALVAHIDELAVEVGPERAAAEPATTQLLNALDDLVLRDPPEPVLAARAELTRALGALARSPLHAHQARSLVALLS